MGVPLCLSLCLCIRLCCSVSAGVSLSFCLCRFVSVCEFSKLWAVGFQIWEINELCVMSGCGMTSVGAKVLASWLTGNPPLTTLRMAGEQHAPLYVNTWCHYD